MTQITQDPKLAALHLKKGKVVALPTETVYGLAASILEEEALSAIFKLKNRPQDNPLIVHAKNLEMIESFAKITPDFLKLYKAFMPGPLTVLLEAKGVSDIITCGLKTVGVRIPSHPLFLQVLEHLNAPIAAPSANLSGKPSSTNIAHVMNDFAPKLPLILDGGNCSGGIESTIIGCYNNHILLLRPGLITKEALETLMQKPVIFACEKTPHQAPGMRYRHYAPQATLKLIDTLEGIDLLDQHSMICSEKPIRCAHWEALSEANLYSALRKGDVLGLKQIYIVITPSISEGLYNRIKKAAS